MAFSTPPSLRDTSPIANATQRRSLIVDFPLTASSISCGITRYLHPPPLCFAAQNIGGVPAGRGGQYKQKLHSQIHRLYLVMRLQENRGKVYS